MTAAMSGTPEKVTSARFVARLTDAETTPGVPRIAFSTRSTQESQAMPSTRTLKAAGSFGLEKREDIDFSFMNDLIRCWLVGPPDGLDDERPSTTFGALRRRAIDAPLNRYRIRRRRKASPQCQWRPRA